jgi:hypothetical protein
MNRLDFGDSEYAKIGLPLVESIQRIMRALFGPFGPGRRPRSGKNNMRYFRFLSTLCRCHRVEGFRAHGGMENACKAHEKGT